MRIDASLKSLAMDLQEKLEEKDQKNIGILTRMSPKIKGAY